MTDNPEPQEPRKFPVQIQLTAQEIVLLMEFGDTHLIEQTASTIVSNTLLLWKPVHERQVAQQAKRDEERAFLRSMFERLQREQRERQSSETPPPENTDQEP